MGVNAMGISYVTVRTWFFSLCFNSICLKTKNNSLYTCWQGYGKKSETDTHDRLAWSVGQDQFWPKGWLSGGPNNELINDPKTPSAAAAAKSYAGRGTAPQAWCSKENTINWNAPLAWVAWYIENKVVPNLGDCWDANCLSSGPTSNPTTLRPVSLNPTPVGQSAKPTQPTMRPSTKETLAPSSKSPSKPPVSLSFLFHDIFLFVALSLFCLLFIINLELEFFYWDWLLWTKHWLPAT